jgi:tetratricopeptide (TPR) repeat protein
MNRRLPRQVAILTALGLGLVAPVMACYDWEFESVRFNDARPDFFRMPRPWLSWSEKRAIEPQRAERAYDGYNEYWEPARRQVPLRERLRDAARQIERLGQFRQAADLWNRHRLACLDDGEDDQVRPSLADRLAVLRDWRTSADSPDLRAYLRARDLVDSGDSVAAAAALSTIRSPRFRRHAAYLQAAILFHRDDPQCLPVCRRLLLRQPRNPLAAYLLGRCLLAPVLRDEGGAWDPGTAPSASHPQLREATSAFTRCSELAPRTFLAHDALGKAGAGYYRMHDLPRSLSCYLRQLARSTDPSQEQDAWVSARICLNAMRPADHGSFQRLALTQPELGPEYLDLILYWNRRGGASTARLGAFAIELLRRQPRASVAARVLVRIALIENRLGRGARASALASAALDRARDTATRDQARWQLAEGLARGGRTRASLSVYESLAASAGQGRLRRGAHESAAILAERLGDLPNAIRHYFALDYVRDYGYAIDVLASLEDLKAFLRRWPGHPRANLVRYSLGWRQLAAGENAAAVRTFESLGAWRQAVERKNPRTSTSGSPCPSPLWIARFLLDSERAERSACTPAEKAKIAYAVGRLFFRQRYELLYNSALWDGRVDTFSREVTDINHLQRTNVSPSEQAARVRHLEQYSSLRRALQAFERIADRYPRTPEAPRALYSAALCYSYLHSQLDTVWVKERKLNPFRRSVECYHRLQREYPDDPLAVDAARWGGSVRQ